MPDIAAVIKRVIAEHHSIREHVKLTEDTVNDIEALYSLHSAQSGWSQTSITALTEKQDQLLQTVSFLEQGLRNHFSFEEKALPAIFGQLLMRAFLHQHDELDGKIDVVSTALANIKLQGEGQREMFSRRSAIQENIDSLCNTVEEHANHEEIILNMMKEALDEETRFPEKKGRRTTQKSL